MILNIIAITIACLVVIAAIGFTVYVVGRNLIFQKYFEEQATSNESFAELLEVLILIVNSEIEQYEKEIFFVKGSVTNSNFNNFYEDMCDKVIAAISDDLMIQFERYVNHQYVYTLIARRVKEYLKEKVHTPE